MLREVSGRKNAMSDKHDAAAMDKNQKIHCQPTASLKLPPKTGPMLGAHVILIKFNLSRFEQDPLSAGDATSVMTP
ncbi:uncharacterized protein KY384_004395 [Bacidia gigantensis]|uniref:uncharacterized protein n=1 Tax=Bacidia gigantensis TaxID=2732470 RepID=UPI001D04C71E|nr:uncharacterized protein KY384_004395 [Bacidia gigantensis]KAG8531038.1 hypothetical protein KY384_004395 [Bacidia gigantensis]